jgi:hypothetical protein
MVATKVNPNKRHSKNNTVVGFQIYEGKPGEKLLTEYLENDAEVLRQHRGVAETAVSEIQPGSGQAGSTHRVLSRYPSSYQHFATRGCLKRG